LAPPWKNGRRAGNSGVMLAVLAAVVIKTIAAELPLIALRGPSRPSQDPPRVLAWAEAAILIVYGPVQTAAGLLDQTDLITRRPPPIIGRASTKGEPSGRTGSGLPGLLVWISGRAKRQPVARFSVGDQGGVSADGDETAQIVPNQSSSDGLNRHSGGSALPANGAASTGGPDSVGRRSRSCGPLAAKTLAFAGLGVSRVSRDDGSGASRVPSP
jgi:hypothetical protein